MLLTERYEVAKSTYEGLIVTQTEEFRLIEVHTGRGGVGPYFFCKLATWYSCLHMQ